MSDDSYPRDMVGYGRNPPDPRWPGGARIAVQFVLNYEEGGENCILHGDAASEAFLSEIIGAPAAPGRAPHEHGIDLRVWQPRRLLAAVADVRRARACRSRSTPSPWRCERNPRGRRRHGGGRLGDRQPRPDAGSTTSTWSVEDERRQMARGDPHPHRGHRRAAAGLVHRPRSARTRCGSWSRRAASSTAPTATPTTCPTG